MSSKYSGNACSADKQKRAAHGRDASGAPAKTSANNQGHAAARKSDGKPDGSFGNPHGRPQPARKNAAPRPAHGPGAGFAKDGRKAPIRDAAKPDAETAGAEGARLNKAIAASGLCSRRKADELILAGRVSVNGMPEPNPARHVLPADAISVDGRVLAAQQAFTYLLLHKPVQVVCTASDPEGRATVLDCLDKKYQGLRLYPVGRLDYFSEGLLLLTNDGQLAQRLTHPRHHQPKTYEVLVRGPVPDAALKVMRDGMRLAEGETLLPVEVTTRNINGNTLMQMVLHQGLNRQIRRMCRDLGLTVLRLCRTAQGALRLGDLASGAVRPLTDAEVARLRECVGLSAGGGPAR